MLKRILHFLGLNYKNCSKQHVTLRHQHKTASNGKLSVHGLTFNGELIVRMFAFENLDIQEGLIVQKFTVFFLCLDFCRHAVQEL